MAFWDNSVSGVHLETKKNGGIQNDPKHVEKQKKKKKKKKREKKSRKEEKLAHMRLR